MAMLSSGSERGVRERAKNLPQVYEHAASAVRILAREMGTTDEAATAGLIALFKAGIVVGPIEPTNSMLYAYLNAFSPKPKRHDSILTAIAKAKLRWRAMANTANQVAISPRAGTADAAPDFRCPCLFGGTPSTIGPANVAASPEASPDAKTVDKGQGTGEAQGNRGGAAQGSEGETIP